MAQDQRNEQVRNIADRFILRGPNATNVSLCDSAGNPVGKLLNTGTAIESLNGSLTFTFSDNTTETVSAGIADVTALPTTVATENEVVFLTVADGDDVIGLYFRATGETTWTSAGSGVALTQEEIEALIQDNAITIYDSSKTYQLSDVVLDSAGEYRSRRNSNTAALTDGNAWTLISANIDANILNNLNSNTTHRGQRNNPHEVTKAQVGLTNADDTSDLAKPISTLTQTALDAKLNTADLNAAVSANTNVAANTAKTGITTDQAAAITANTAKTGITANQATAITANTAKDNGFSVLNFAALTGDTTNRKSTGTNAVVTQAELFNIEEAIIPSDLVRTQVDNNNFYTYIAVFDSATSSYSIQFPQDPAGSPLAVGDRASLFVIENGNGLTKDKEIALVEGATIPAGGANISFGNNQDLVGVSIPISQAQFEAIRLIAGDDQVFSGGEILGIPRNQLFAFENTAVPTHILRNVYTYIDAATTTGATDPIDWYDNSSTTDTHNRVDGISTTQAAAIRANTAKNSVTISGQDLTVGGTTVAIPTASDGTGTPYLSPIIAGTDYGTDVGLRIDAGDNVSFVTTVNKVVTLPTTGADSNGFANLAFNNLNYLRIEVDEADRRLFFDAVIPNETYAELNALVPTTRLVSMFGVELPIGTIVQFNTSRIIVQTTIYNTPAVMAQFPADGGSFDVTVVGRTILNAAGGSGPSSGITQQFADTRYAALSHTHTASEVTDFDTEVGNNPAVTANTAKTGITDAQASAITANTAKTGITDAQATAIAANTLKVSGISEESPDWSAIAAYQDNIVINDSGTTYKLAEGEVIGAAMNVTMVPDPTGTVSISAIIHSINSSFVTNPGARLIITYRNDDGTSANAPAIVAGQSYRFVIGAGSSRYAFRVPAANLITTSAANTQVTVVDAGVPGPGVVFEFTSTADPDLPANQADSITRVLNQQSQQPVNGSAISYGVGTANPSPSDDLRWRNISTEIFGNPRFDLKSNGIVEFGIVPDGTTGVIAASNRLVQRVTSNVTRIIEEDSGAVAGLVDGLQITTFSNFATASFFPQGSHIAIVNSGSPGTAIGFVESGPSNGSITTSAQIRVKIISVAGDNGDWLGLTS